MVILQDKLRTVLSIWKRKQPASFLGKAAQLGQTSISPENQYNASEESVLPSGDDKEPDKSTTHQVESLFYVCRFVGHVMLNDFLDEIVSTTKCVQVHRVVTLASAIL